MNWKEERTPPALGVRQQTVVLGMGSVWVGTVEPQFETEPIQGGLNILNRGLIKPVQTNGSTGGSNWFI